MNASGQAMSNDKNIHFWTDRAKFFEIGRVLRRNWRSSNLGPVSLTVRHGNLTIMSKCGGGEIECEGVGEVSAELTDTAFRSLINSRRREIAPSGRMKLTFRPQFGEVAIDVAGVKAQIEVVRNTEDDAGTSSKH